MRGRAKTATYQNEKVILHNPYFDKLPSSLLDIRGKTEYVDNNADWEKIYKIILKKDKFIRYNISWSGEEKDYAYLWIDGKVWGMDTNVIIDRTEGDNIYSLITQYCWDNSKDDIYRKQEATRLLKDLLWWRGQEARGRRQIK
jgi:hypothetical protein